MGKSKRKKQRPNPPQLPQPQPHPLVEPRLVAAVGLIALGVGLGLGLMLARVLIFVGYSVSLVCAMGVVWLYARHMRAAYNAVAHRMLYKGAPITELLIAVGMVIVLVAVANTVLPVVLLKEPTLDKANLQFATIAHYKIPNGASTGTVNIEIHDAGSLDATEVITVAKGHIADALMSADEIKSELAAMDEALNHADTDKNRATSTPIRPTQNGVITLQDIGSQQWIDVLDERINVPTISMTDATWNEFMEAKHIIYVFMKSRYGDEALHGKAYWQTNFCGYFVGTTSLWHNCSSNQTNRISDRRP